LNRPASEITQWLREQEHKELLRFITCGSVDDGKSTLIGRLLYESKQIFDDQLAALEGDSKRHGTQGDEIDFALLVDGLPPSEKAITIDVAYRFFTSESASSLSPTRPDTSNIPATW
jgi:bifunctional enzyme CysN/CysC